MNRRGFKPLSRTSARRMPRYRLYQRQGGAVVGDSQAGASHCKVLDTVGARALLMDLPNTLTER
jgi:hypothetical protein